MTIQQARPPIAAQDEQFKANAIACSNQTPKRALFLASLIFTRSIREATIQVLSRNNPSLYPEKVGPLSAPKPRKRVRQFPKCGDLVPKEWIIDMKLIPLSRRRLERFSGLFAGIQVGVEFLLPQRLRQFEKIKSSTFFFLNLDKLTGSKSSATF